MANLKSNFLKSIIQRKNQYYKLPASIEEWQIKRNEIYLKISNILGWLGVPKALDVKNYPFRFHGINWKGSKLSIVNSQDGDFIPFFLLTPNNSTTESPIAIVLHRYPWTLNYEIGKSEVVGLAGDSSLSFGKYLAEKGYVVIAPDSVLFEDRNLYGKSTKRFEEYFYGNLLLHGISFLGKMVSDISAIVSFAIKSKLGNPNKLSCIGFSMGGTQAYIASALDERIKATVSICAVRSYIDALRNSIPHPYIWYIPGILNFCDIPQLISLIAPRYFLVISDTDQVIQEGAKRCTKYAKQIYGLYGSEDRIRQIIQKEIHAITPKTLSSIDKWLNNCFQSSFKRIQ